MKTEIIKNPDIEDYFIRLDRQKSFDGYYEKYGDDLARWYETGRVMVMDDAPISADNQLLYSVLFPYGNRPLKKIKQNEISPDLGKSKHILHNVFPKNIALAEKFRKETMRISELMSVGIRRMFPRYKITKIQPVWRFAVTHTEDLHLDVYNQVRDVHVLRLFWNADSFQRIWNCGDHLEKLLQDPRVNSSSVRDPEDWNRRINSDLLGETKGRVQSMAPMHTVLFAPGTVWIAHSQYIPHSPIFGRRMVSWSVDVEPDSMIDPSLSFSRAPRRLHRAH